jgi:outer membrane protein OmpA-like peptidoglycan-associated protein
VNTPGDAFEQEADRVADQVMGMTSVQTTGSAASPFGAAAPNALQRKCSCGGNCSGCKEEDEGLVQRKTASTNDSGTAAMDVHPRTLDAGSSLDAPTRSYMESRLDADFQHVRIHAGSRAAAAARSVNARAYTVGHDIVFGDGQYSPATTGGQRLLAHELTHVLQQRSGRSMLQRKEDQPADGVGDATTDRCPTAPTGLGNKDPDPPKGPCPRANYAGTNEVSRWHFCLDSDEVQPSDSLANLTGLISGHPRNTRYLVHGHASTDGNADYNFRLSCHRAHKVGDALVEALRGKLARPRAPVSQAELQDRLQVASRGATNEFPGGPEFNRVAVLYAQIPGQDPDEEPACKAAPTHLGDIQPEEPCQSPTMDLTGRSGDAHLQHFQFCLDSDVLSAQTPADVGKFAARQAATARFVIHGFASTEGDAAYNQRLSCHRALRIARELMNAGVRPEQIREVSGVGETDKFSFGVKELQPANRVAVVLAEGGEISPLIDPQTSPVKNEDKQSVVDAARARIMAGQYGLAADFYISRWTCGRTATVRQAVERLTVELPIGADVEHLRDKANGVEEHPSLGVNHVRVSNTALGADNPVECTMGRLIDMAFHHAVVRDPGLPSLLTDADSPGLRHQAGLHLIALAGLNACKGRYATAAISLGHPVGIDEPVDDDPLNSLSPPECARAPQPARLLPPTPGEKGRRAPDFVFEKNDMNYTFHSGRLDALMGTADAESITATSTLMAPATDMVNAQANVSLIGKAETFADYEIGFIQAVVEDFFEAEYVSGHRAIQQLPVPISPG